MEKPYVPFYIPYGMSEEEYKEEVKIAERKLLEWEISREEQDNTPDPFTIYKERKEDE